MSDGVPEPGAGNIEVAGATDIYYFNGTTGQIVFLEDLGAAASFGGYARLDLYHPNGNWLTGEGLGDGNSLGRQVLPATGQYRIVVFAASTDPNHIGTYSFKLGHSRPPVPGPDFAATTRDRAVILPLAKLLANDVDPDGNPLSVTLPVTTSAEGGTLSLGASSVIYTPPAGFTGTDTFEYGSTDNIEPAVLALVTVEVRAPEEIGFTTITIEFLSGGGAEVRLAGIPGRTYRVEWSDDLVTWTLLTTTAADAHGVIIVNDPTASEAPQRFYRLNHL